MPLLVSSHPESASNHRTTNQDNNICHIKNTCVKRANTNKHEVANQTVSRNTVNQVTYPARPNQGKANE